MLVSNASTLILLAKIDLLREWLNQTRVVIPEEVFLECVSEKKRYDALLIDSLVRDNAIGVIKVSQTSYAKVLAEFRMGAGESAAFALFYQQKAEAIMTDDAELIKLCKISQVHFLCAPAIIIALWELKKINKQEAKEKLVLLRKFGRYSPELYALFENLLR